MDSAAMQHVVLAMRADSQLRDIRSSAEPRSTGTPAPVYLIDFMLFSIPYRQL
jgi:hypothetical protein